MLKLIAVLAVAAVTLFLGLRIARSVGFSPEPPNPPDTIIIADTPSPEPQRPGEEDDEWDEFEEGRRRAAVAAAAAAAKAVEAPVAPPAPTPAPQAPVAPPPSQVQPSPDL